MNDIATPPRRIKRGWMNLKVERIDEETWDTKTFILVDADEGGRPFDYTAGQYLTFRFDDVAYCTDVNKIPKESWPLLEGLRILVLDALRYKPHPGHFSLDEAVDAVQRLQPKQAYFTHMSHDLDHEATNRKLPPSIQLAYDGLSFEF